MEQLNRIRSKQKPLAVVAVILVLLGGAYLVYAAQSLKEHKNLDQMGAGLDRPVARLATLFAPELERLDALTPQSDREQVLIEGYREQLVVNAALLLLVLRVLIGSLLLTSGCIFLAVYRDRKDLLALFDAELLVRAADPS